MVERKRIGLTFSYNEEWIAGSYYILNIVHALRSLEENQQPVVVIISEDQSNFHIVKKETGYPHLEFCKYPVEQPSYYFYERLINKVGSVFGVKKAINKTRKWAELDFLYPYEVDRLTSTPLKKVNWVPDFQERHLPHLFSEEILLKRKKHQQEIVCKGDWVVFSSEDSKKDFVELYPQVNINTYVLPFAVTHPNFKEEDLIVLYKKYQLPQKFYFAPNQFWAHKNHKVILEAVKIAKEHGVEIHIAFSGKENDHRNADYVQELKSYIAQHNLSSNISFLGFMPRIEQLALLQESVAIVQPSKFEGWSTVVEDAKALQKFIVLSDIAVHKEQLSENAHFFNPDNREELATILKTYWEQSPEVVLHNYNEQKKQFAQNFMELVHLASSS